MEFREMLRKISFPTFKKTNEIDIIKKQEKLIDNPSKVILYFIVIVGRKKLFVFSYWI